MRIFILIFLVFCGFLPNPVQAYYIDPLKIQEVLNRPKTEEHVIEIIFYDQYGVGWMQLEDGSEWISPDLYMRHDLAADTHVWVCPMSKSERAMNSFEFFRRQYRITHWIINEQCTEMYRVARGPKSKK